MLMDKFVQFDMKVKFNVSRYLQCMCHLLSVCAICTNIQLGTNITLIYLIHLSKLSFCRKNQRAIILLVIRIFR